MLRPSSATSTDLFAPTRGTSSRPAASVAHSPPSPAHCALSLGHAPATDRRYRGEGNRTYSLPHGTIYNRTYHTKPRGTRSTYSQNLPHGTTPPYTAPPRRHQDPPLMPQPAATRVAAPASRSLGLAGTIVSGWTQRTTGSYYLPWTSAWTGSTVVQLYRRNVYEWRWESNLSWDALVTPVRLSVCLSESLREIWKEISYGAPQAQNFAKFTAVSSGENPR